MATAATTAQRLAMLTTNGVTLPTIDGSAPANSWAYDVIDMVFEIVSLGIDAVLTDGVGGILIDENGDQLAADI